MRVVRHWGWAFGLMLVGGGCGPGSLDELLSDGSGGSSIGGDSGDTATDPTTSTTGAMGTGAAESSSSGSEVDGSGSEESGDPLPEPPEPACGDGVLDPLEECDDGNAVDDDECNNDCVATAAIVWEVVIPPGGEGSCANEVAVSPTGQIGLGGRSLMGAESINAWVGMLADDGSLQWEDDWDGGQQEPDEVLAVAFDGVGDLYLAATEENVPSNDQDAWLYKRGADGSAQWAMAMDRAPDGSNYAADVVVGPDDGATLLAASYGGGFAPGLRMQRHAPNGDLVWPSPVRLGDDVMVTNDSILRQDASGDLYVIGVNDRPDTPRRAFVERYSLDGILQWSAESNPPISFGSGRMVVGATQADGDSTLALHDAFAPDDLVLRSWDAEGSGPEAVVPGFDRELHFSDATFDSMGNLIVVGVHSGDGWVIKIDPAGTFVWARPTTNHDINGVAVAADDEVLVAGCVDGVGGGAQIWVRRYAP